MARQLHLDTLLAACLDDSFEDGIRIDTELEPGGGPGNPVKPASTKVSLPDRPQMGVPGRRRAHRRHRDRQRSVTGEPSGRGAPHKPLLVWGTRNGPRSLRSDRLPAHLPRRISSLEFPHRNADAYFGTPNSAEGFREDRHREVHLRRHRPDLRTVDGVVPPGPTVRILAVAPG